MKNRLGVLILTILLVVICTYYLSMTLVSRSIQNKAVAYATGADGKIDLRKKQRYMDSLWNQPVFLGQSLKKIKQFELSLGLDLQGGMHLLLEVSPEDILRGLAGEAVTPEFEKALQKAKEESDNRGSALVDRFFRNFKEIAPQTPLADIFANSSTKGRLEFNSSDDEVIKYVKEEVEGSVKRAYEIIRARIDKFGVSQPNIQLIPGTGRIQVELPGADNPDRVRKLIAREAKLEFLEVVPASKFVQYLESINKYLVALEKAKKSSKTDTTGLTTNTTSLPTSADTTQKEEDLFLKKDTAKSTTDTTKSKLEQEVSVLFRLQRGAQQEIAAFDALFYEASDTSVINEIFARPEVKKKLPAGVDVYWGVKPLSEKDTRYPLYFLKRERGGRARLTGSEVTNAYRDFHPLDQKPYVSMQMSVSGAREWAKMTKQAASQNPKGKIAIVLDNEVYSAPTVQSEIEGGQSQITGDFTIEEASDLANVLQTGKLPARPRVVEEAVVGPSLGKVAQRQGLFSAAIGFVLIIAFMIAYYSKGGIVANIALLFNLFFIVGVLTNFGAALTLPGIAGIVLTMGMAVDANVLIFERIKEEMSKGMLLTDAIKKGFDRAYWTIVDSNLTTFLTALFLMLFGLGPIKGFAITLMIGIACSFFTAVFVSRLIIDYLTRKGKDSNFTLTTTLSRLSLISSQIDFLNQRKFSFIFSGTLLALGLLCFLIAPPKYGVDFSGGRSYVVEFDKSQEPSAIKSALGNDLSAEVKTYGSNKTLKITTNYLLKDESPEADSIVFAVLKSKLETATGSKFVENQKSVAPGTFSVLSTSKVEGTIALDIRNSAGRSVLFSLAAIFIYILARFRSVSYSIGAVVALIHDTLMVFAFLGMTSLAGFGFEMDQVFVAAVLTVIGYSINDTVVVYDRIREYYSKTLGAEASLNDAINNTLKRTILTSLTTLVVVLALLLMGGDSLRGFSFAVLIGIAFGTYSSIYIATPIAYLVEEWLDKRRAHQTKPIA